MVLSTLTNTLYPVANDATSRYANSSYRSTAKSYSVVAGIFSWLKNLVKIDAMTQDQVSLSNYNVPFYIPRDIYLDQLNMIDNRLIYNGVQLVSYIVNDSIGIKERTLQELNINKQRILIELRELKNG